MQKITMRLIVYFDDPFWIGVCERFTDGQLEVCKITFGTEPKDYEVHQFLLQNWSGLRFSPPLEAGIRRVENSNPKRMHRAIRKQMKSKGIATKSQQALKLQQDENKLVRKSTSRKRKEDEKQRQFELRQKKRKEKHRGR